MILVLLGTENFPFNRLLEYMDVLIEEGSLDGDQVFAQRGSTDAKTAHFKSTALLDFEALCEQIRAARLIISHAGAGTCLLAMRLGKRPIVVPRRANLGEHIDDHQLEFSQRLAREGHVLCAEGLEELRDHIKRELSRNPTKLTGTRPTALIGHIENLLSGWGERSQASR